MSRSFASLERVLQLEIQQNFQDKAVVGGIRQFAAYWVGQAREEAVDEADQALVEQVAEVLSGYGKLPGREARQEAINGLFRSLDRRKERLQKSGEQPVVQSDRRKPAPPKPASKPAPLPRARDDTVETEDDFSPSTFEELADIDEPESLVEIAEPDPEGLRQPVSAIKGVGPRIAQKLEALGARSIRDLIFLFPRRYDDYTLMKPINRLEYGEQVTVIGTVWQTRARRLKGNKTVIQVVISDGTGTVQASWFNQPWLAKQLPAGKQIVISGKVEQFLGRPVFNSPDWEHLELDPLRTRRIVPVYKLTEGLGSGKMREIMKSTVSYWGPRVPDALPESIRQSLNLYALPQAMQQIHFPDTQTALHKARRRLSFDELFLLQLGMQSQRYQWQARSASPIPVDREQMASFYELLPFSLTGAQERVIDEILSDMAGDVPMNRLLQGDVGAGKTVVAAAAMVVTARAGAQAALMAPTEILAEQHYRGLSDLLEPLGLEIALLTGSTSLADKAAVLDSLANGTVQMIVGTHALIQDNVHFKNLSLVIIDEQHRFGVDQRAKLRDKGSHAENQTNPHLLVMSATPIPRTLALSLYGDLDMSILDEVPPGRQEIKTRWLRASERERAYTFIRRQVEEGRQAFIIFPLVEESDSIDALAAVAEYELLKNDVFPDIRLGLVHGRLKSDQKEAVMRAFYTGELDVLVATSVIEVGVDVPNSTVMVIEGANRFGLAQLHQFRGRVGRGEHQSYCVLIADESTPEAEKRLTALEETNDGFYLAEKDLELRGPGEFFGRRQSGLPELRMASLLDLELLKLAQKEAAHIFEVDPELELPDHELLREQLSLFWGEAGDAS